MDLFSVEAKICAAAKHRSLLMRPEGITESRWQAILRYLRREGSGKVRAALERTTHGNTR